MLRSVYLVKIVKIIYEFFKREVHKILELKDSQHAVAGGVAIGIFFGFTPLYGVKTLLSVGVAWLFGCNVIAAAVAVTLHDVLLPLMPIVLRLEYEMGYWMIHHHLPPSLSHSVHHLKPVEYLKWTTFFGVGMPMLLGSLVFAIPSAVVSYGITLGILNARKRRHEKAAEKDFKQD